MPILTTQRYNLNVKCKGKTKFSFALQCALHK